MFTDFGATEVDMDFSTPIFAWGADFNGAGTGELLNLDLILDMGGSTAIVPVTISDGFFGFVTTPAESLGMITFRSRNNNPGSGGEGFGLDNVSGAVPEPSSLALLGVAVVGLARRLRRKRAA